MSESWQNSVAIIGVAGHFPDAENPHALWSNLCAGKESIRAIQEQDIEDGLTAAQRAQGSYVAARALLKGVDLFDAEFFHFLPREAELTDPQQRVLLECAWEAFEDAGYDPARVAGNVGVFAGSSINTYLLLQLASDPKFREEFTRSYQVGSFPALVGNGQDFLATRISYKLNLRGPAMTVQSACSTSLLAVAQAWQSLVNFQADLALAGGVSISFPQQRGYFYQEGGMVSPDGHCRPFDRLAAGTVFGAGAGMVLLKRTEEAITDGDHIYALLLGAGINNDGSDKVGYAAPSLHGQAEAIATAYAVAGVDASSVGYVECHGTGTPLGDPIEVAALAQVFGSGQPRNSSCVLSSLKGNLGHLDVAAGVTGLIKAALSLDGECIPGTLHYSEPNPQLELGNTSFEITSETTKWPRTQVVRRAGVSAFGVGGTNVHVVLEEAPKPTLLAERSSIRSQHVVCLSARTEAALNAQQLQLAAFLEQGEAEELFFPDIAYTLATGRRTFAHRFAVRAADRKDALEKLRGSKTPASSSANTCQTPRVVMLFPGQGSQYPGMGEDLYRTESYYRQIVDDCCEQLKILTGLDLQGVLYPSVMDEDATYRLEQTEFAQPALFVTSYALARLWMHWGVEPSTMIGHSVGELVAACLAGIFSLEDALLFVACRGEWMQEVPSGAMLAVRMQPELLQNMLPASLSIAAINAPSLCVASGPEKDIADLVLQLEKKKIVYRRLHTSHAFHSAMVTPVVERLLHLLAGMELRAPKVRIVSTVTGKELTTVEAVSPDYWAQHCRVPVNFSAAVARAVEEGNEVFLEAGAGNTLVTLVRQHLAKNKKIALCSSLPSADSENSAEEALADAVASLWMQHVPLDWKNYYIGENHRRVPLPTYPFQRKRYWVERKQEIAVFSSDHQDFDSRPAIAEPLQNSHLDASHVQKIDRSKTLNALEIAMIHAIDSKSQAGATSISSDSGDTSRVLRLSREIAEILEELSGVELTSDQLDASFLELGFDSLFLTQAAQKLQTTYKVKLAFRQLLDALYSIRLVAAYIDGKLPEEATVAKLQQNQAKEMPQEGLGTAGHIAPQPVVKFRSQSLENLNTSDGSLAGLMQQQLHAMSQLIQSQLHILGNSTPAGISTKQSADLAIQTAPTFSTPEHKVDHSEKNEEHVLPKSPVQQSQTPMTPEQQRFIAACIERYCHKTQKSKLFTQQHRRTLADPRVVSGFRPEWKEMVYSLVSDRSKGSKLWDLDGNEYVDLVNGFGPTMFGHSPSFVVQAIQQQLEEGFAIGPQTSLAGQAADLLTEMTGTDRVTFCNTGSEAVMAAMRIARTVTGRDRVVFFAGDYHGQFDEVLVKQLKRKGEFLVQPAAPGIPRANLGSVTVLDYGTEESLRYIEQHADELAAVLIEPIQSRHPHLQPKEFLTRVREITRQSGTAFIFDEVVTGFRIHPRGAQGYYGIDADMVSYGKVVGGGMPIGILAGKRAFMDALDGGYWEFGDSSVPEAGVTFFAGTFVRHPLTMAALCATLKHMRSVGEKLYQRLNERSTRFADQVNKTFSNTGVPFHMEQCGSVMYFSVPSEVRFGGLLYYLLREKGVYILEGFPIYLTTEHTDQDLQKVLHALQESIQEMQSCNLLPGDLGNVAAPNCKSISNSKEKDTVTVTDIPLTEPQLEIMLAAQGSDEASCAFNESFTLRLTGPLHRDALMSAWRGLLSRHDALRMSVMPSGDRMHIHPSADAVALTTVDISGKSYDMQQQELHKIVAAEGITPFDLAGGPLVRSQLVCLGGKENLLIVTAHHLVCDGWSVNVMIDELGKLYSAAMAGKTVELPTALPFSQYAIRVASKDAQHKLHEDLLYWKQQLTPEPELLTLPAEGNRPASRGFAGATLVTEFPADFAIALRKTGAKLGCTLFTTLLGGWQALLWRLSGNEDPITLIPAAAQSQLEDATLVGHCVHLLPIRAAIQPAMSAADYLKALKPVVLDAYEHQNATYGSIVRELKPAREAGRLPISEIQFNLEQVGTGVVFEGLHTQVQANGKRAINFDLFLNIVDTGKGLRLECDYNTGLYAESTIAGWLESYHVLLQGIVEDATQSVSMLPLLTDEVRQYVLEQCNVTQTGPLPAQNIPALIDAAFQSMPSQPAAEFYGLELSREELGEQSDRLAAWLVRHGAETDSLVGIYMDRSLEMLVAMLGVMKAGAAYVPLDPMFPRQRIEQILDETNVPVLLTLSRHMEELPRSNAQVFCLDTELAALSGEPALQLPEIAPDARAYVIFTSGSTGRPKGVEVMHRSVVNLLIDLQQRLEIGPTDRLLAITTLSFDISVLEMLLPLVSGGTVLIAHRDDVIDGARLIELIEATRATVLQATPITWRMLLELGFRAKSDFKMLCGGEAWSHTIAHELLEKGGRMWNMYGPTETTVWSSVTEVKKDAMRITIGPPIANTRFYVLDARLQVVPPGVPGELFIAGTGVARGYFDRQELTLERFLADPYVTGERMYRTGDEVRQRMDGTIEFIGRLDQQVKLHGFRIELGEVETAMRALPGVRDAVAAVRTSGTGEKMMVGYYTGAEQESPATLRQELRNKLPFYMVPTVLQSLAALPQTPNGKLDRRALPALESWTSVNNEDYLAPRTATETTLADIFCEVLGCDRISIRASLMENGADSLRMFQIAARAQRRGLKVTARLLMQLRTVEGIAAAVEDSDSAVGRPIANANPLQRIAREHFRMQT